MSEAPGQIEHADRIKTPAVKLEKRNTPFSQSVLTREKQIPGTETERGIVTRFQRGEIVRAYHLLRKPIDDLTKEAAVKFASGQDKAGFQALEAKLGPKEFLARFREEARKLEANLDTLNKQFYSEDNITVMEINDPEIGSHKIPVITLDLNPPAEGQEDTRSTVFVVGSYVTNFHETAAFSMALALAGNKVVVPTYPEKDKMATPPKDWVDRVKKDGTLRPYAQLMKKISRGMGITRPNLVGISMGAAISLEMATDPDFDIGDITVIEPPTVIEKHTLEQLFDFGVREGIPAILDAEARTKVVLSESPELAQRIKGADLALAPILARRQITKEKLRMINPHGKYRLILGEKSSITGRETFEEFVKAEDARLAANPEASPIEIYIIQGGAHGSAVIHSEGVVSQIISSEKPRPGITNVSINSLENSAAALILNRM